MMSYSRNLEDVVLHRVFGDVGVGTYVDVGAGHPLWDSNTYALYRRGWRGVVVEPLLRFKPYNEAWNELRPGDTRVSSMAGAGIGKRELQIFESLQLSTGCAEVADLWTRGGKPPARTELLDVVRIADLMPPDPVHFMNIDVEGMEREVIAGLGPRLPWVVCLETTRPGTSQIHDPTIIDSLVSRGYRLAYFDGINAFLLSDYHLNLRKFFRLDAPGGFVQYSKTKECQELYKEWQGRVKAEASELFA
jgi:FkbM family methyltransferase